MLPELLGKHPLILWRQLQHCITRPRHNRRYCGQAHSSCESNPRQRSVRHDKVIFYFCSSEESGRLSILKAPIASFAVMLRSTAIENYYLFLRTHNLMRVRTLPVRDCSGDSWARHNPWAFAAPEA